MTLIVSPGEDVLSSSSDDGDSGCLAGSPTDLKEESRPVHNLILASKLKRLSLQDVKALQQTSASGLDESPMPNPANILKSESQSDTCLNRNHINGDNKGGVNVSRDVRINKDLKNQGGDDSVNNSSSSSRPVLIYECTVSLDSIPSASSQNENPKKPERKLVGPAVITTPDVQLASQVNISESDKLIECIPPVQQKSMLKTQSMVCNNNNNNNYCNEKSSSSSGLVSDDVTETLTPPCPSTSSKGSENGEEVGGYSGGVAESVEGDIHDSNGIKILKSTVVNGDNESEKAELEIAPSICDKEGAFGSACEKYVNEKNVRDSSVSENELVTNKISQTEIKLKVTSDNTHTNHSFSEEGTSNVDIRQAKERINLLRQNFLSSLSAEEDGDPPEVTVLPPYSEIASKDGKEEREEKSEESGKQRKDKSVDLDEKDKCKVDDIKVMEGSECGSNVNNGSDFAQEAGEEEKEEEEREEVPGGIGSNSKCQVMQSSIKLTFYDTEHLDRDSNNATAQDNTSLDVVPLENAIPEEEREEEREEVVEDERVSSIKLLVSEASARLLEHDLSGRLEASSDITVCESGNVIFKNDITPETTMGSGIVDLPNKYSSPPSELPPSPPPSPPPPPSSPQSPNLFLRDGSSSPPNYLKSQSANFVNLMMLQSRKHKRLHRLRVPDTVSSVTDLQHGGGENGRTDGGDEVVRNADCHAKIGDCNDDCERRFQPQPPSAQPPQPHGNPHVQKQLPSFTTASTTTTATIAHCGTTDQLCRPGPPSPHSSTEYVVKGSNCSPHHSRKDFISDQDSVSHLLRVPVRCQSNKNQRQVIRTTSARKSEEGRNVSADSYDDENEWRSACASENDSVFENESCCSDNSCLGYLNFDHESFVDSDNEYDIEQKNRLREACKDIARALNTLPSPLPEEPSIYPHTTKPQYRDQEVEAHLSDTDDLMTINTLSVQVRSCGTSTTSDDDRRNSFYDNCGMDGGQCECGRCDNSDVEEPRSRFPHPPPPPPPGSPPPPIPPVRIMDKWRKSHREKDSFSRDSRRDTSDNELEDEGFRTDVGDGCRTDEFDVCTTSDDNDYDDDYCQTDDCGEECDYCSGDDAEDEAEDTCFICKHSQNVTPVCKHPGVITNGILKSFNGRGREEKECGVRGVPHGRSLALQAAIHRRRLTRQGLVAIRESSITSDELPESEEEQSYDGSNCDISSSWRYGLCRDMTVSRDSTLRSVHSDRSSSSLPAEQVRQRHKEKSNSLPGANSRSISGELSGRYAAGSGFSLRQMSASDDESGSHSSLPRLPPRPPRAPRMRPPLTPSPPAGSSLIAPASPISPRPAMGLQGLQQQRSPGTPRALHVSGLPVAPRTVAPRSPSNPNPPYGFPTVCGGPTLLCPGSPSLAGRSTPSPGAGSEGAPASPRINSRAGALVTRNFSISDDEGGGRWSGGRRHVTITRHESVYKEVAEKGYHLPPGSPVDPYWLTWKLGVLQKTVEEVSGRLEEAQKTADGWGPVSQDPNLADQHAHNVRKFREGLAELQRGVDDVNDQAARFSAHNVPLTPANSAKLHDLNNRWKSLETAVNDRWRQVASRSREVTPLTPAQLASSVSPPWERATTSNKVPYYINHDQESTHWDHPVMMDLLDSMNEFNHIKFSAYRTATKLRMLQKKLALDLAKLQMATDIFDEHGLRGQNDRLIDVNDMVVVLSALYANISADHPEVNTTLAMDLCLNWLLNVYDSQRTGQMRVLSFKIGLVCLCFGHLEEKYRYMFRLIADPNRLVDQRKLGLLLHDCVQVPRQLGEVAAFGGSNIEPSVRSCFTKAGKDRETIEAVHFLTWVQQEPQSLVWLAVLHRVAASENIQHQVKCNICKAYPIIGLRYRCLKCLSFDMCQQCFFEGRSGKSHKITHPMHEYCTATTAGEDVKDFTKALKNKFKSKRSLQKHTKKGYLPVQTVLEGDPLESPSPSPQHNVTSQDMHSRLELYASRLAEVELRTNSNSTPDSEDEHGLIAQYCQSLSSSDAPLPVPRSPLQIMAAVDAEQKDELEQMIRALEEENSVLQAEYDRLKSQQPVGSPPDDGLVSQRSEADMLAEAKLLRQHKGRLEARMGILEEHNRQLEAQLHRLRQLLGESGGVSSPNKSGTLQTKSVTASQLAMDSPAKVNGHSNQGGATSAYEGLEQMSEYVRPPPPPMGSVAHVGNLFSRAGDLGKAVGTLVATMTHEGASDLPSDEEDSNASESEEEKAV